jgi:hypothetical protein
MRNAAKIFFALTAGTMSACLAMASDGEYLFDLLKKPGYRQGWNGMMNIAKPPQWLAAFGRSGNGVATPSTSIVIDGVRHELGHVCKPHDCGDNRFQVLFTPGGARAWGLLQEAGKPPRYFGDPAPAQRAALQKAMSD